MEALRASYGGSSDSDPDDSLSPPARDVERVTTLPPPPLSLLSSPNSLAGITARPSPFTPYSHWIFLLFLEPARHISDVFFCLRRDGSLLDHWTSESGPKLSPCPRQLRSSRVHSRQVFCLVIHISC